MFFKRRVLPGAGKAPIVGFIHGFWRRTRNM